MIAIHKKMPEKLHAWAKNHRALAVVTVIGLLVVITAFFVILFLYQTPKHVAAPKQTTKAVVKTPLPPVYYSPLTGEKVADQAATQQAVTGIMIENSPDARPQSGLKQAGIVYEAIAEGGITRFLALYQQAKPQLIGPVRSVRLYYVDWIAPYQASIAHIGGSKFALNEVRNGTYRDLDQFFNAPYYWRATDRYAPHNVYTSFAKLDELNAKKGYTTSTFTAWPRQDGKPAKTPDATRVDVTISSALFNSHYDYDAVSNTYKRSEGGAPHMDREQGQLSPSTVIVMDTTMNLVMEDGWREQIATTGSGRAMIFQNGTVEQTTWTKKDRGSPIIFTSASGKEIPLNRGQTWITAVPANQGGKVVWK